MLSLADLQIKKNLTKLPVYVTGGFRTTEGMAQAIREGAADGIGLGRPITAEFSNLPITSRGPSDLPNILLTGSSWSAPDTKIPENDVGDGVTASDTQIWQAGQTTLAQAKGNVNQ